MFCENCGAQIPDDSTYCTECGWRVSGGAPQEQTVPHQPASPVTPPAMPPRWSQQPQTTAPRHLAPAPAEHDGTKKVLAGIIIAAVLVFSVLAGWLWTRTRKSADNAQPAGNAQTVQFKIVAPGYQSATDSPIPLHVSGTNARQAAVERDVFVSDSSNASVDLEPGDYAVTVPASPLLSGGDMYQTDNIEVNVNIDDSGQLTTPEDQLVIDLPLADPNTVTAEDIENAEAWAKKSGMDQGKVESLVHEASDYQGSRSGDAASDTEASADAQATPATYTYTTESLPVGDMTFTYVQFACDDASVNLSQVNSELKQAAVDASNNPYVGDTTTPQEEAYASFDQFVTYFQNGVACVVTTAYRTNGGPHGWMEMKVRYVWDTEDHLNQALPLLFTDGTYTVSPELLQKCSDAFKTYIASGNVRNPETSEIGVAANDPSQVAEDSANGRIVFFVTPGGYQVYTLDYYLGSYADGRTTISVCDFDGNELGTALPVGDTSDISLGQTGTMTVG